MTGGTGGRLRAAAALAATTFTRLRRQPEASYHRGPSAPRHDPITTIRPQHVALQARIR